MRVSELSERAGVPLATVKFYIREGLLPTGRATGKNRAQYADEHLERLALIRALRDDAGLGIAAIAQALRAADAAGGDFVQAAVDAIERPSGAAVSEQSQAFLAAQADLRKLATRRGWRIEKDDRSLAEAARALTAALRRLAHVSRARLLTAERSERAEPAPKRASITQHADARAQEIYAIVRAIPAGKVATYGQLAELAGIPSGHRLAASAMRSCPKGLPWQRVVGKKDARRAKVAIEEPEHAALQRKLLEAEGVRFDAQGCISLRSFGWLPTELPAATRAKPRDCTRGRSADERPPKAAARGRTRPY